MKKTILFAVLIFMGLGFQTKAQDYYDRGYDNSYNYNGYNNDGFGYFYTSLSPYGSWIEFGDGVYGWKPFHMRNIWAPYSDGQWIWTSDGWYWDSYEPFGYIVYHYGRWYYDDFYGWVWIPDYQWAPAWVDWRYDNDYIGWAPLPPYAIFSVSVGIHFTHVYNLPYAHWHFVRYNYFCDPYVGKYFIGDQYKYRIYSHTKYRHDYGWRDGRVVNRGIDVNLVRKRSGVDVRERNIRTVSNLRDIDARNRVTSNEVRAFVPDKNNFRGARVKDVKIERTDRKTSLETTKLEFGRKDLERKDTKVRNDNKTDTRENNKENPGIRKDTGIRTDRNTTGGNINRGNTDQKQISPRNETGKTDRKKIEKPVERKQERKDSRISDTRIPSKNSYAENTARINSGKNNTQIQRRNESINNNRAGNFQIQKRNENQTNDRTGNAQIQKRNGNGSDLRTGNTQIQKRNENSSNNRTSNIQIQKRNESNSSGNFNVQRQGDRSNVRSKRR